MDELLNVFELAKRIRVSARWLEQEAKAGRIPHLKAGRQFLFNPVAVTRSLARRAAQEPEVGREAAHAA